MIYWLGTKDYASGVVHEPFFYGQNYNVMLESFLAVPFYKLGVPIHIAVPLGTLIAANFSFIFFAFVLRKHAFHSLSFLFLLIPLTMPLGYDLISGLPRGFASGMFLLFPLVYPLLFPKQIGNHLLYTICSSLALIVNPNTLIVILPIGIFLWLKNVEKIRFYVTVCLAAIPALAIHQWIKAFYQSHPNYNVMQLIKLEFSGDLWLNAFGKLDKFFSDLTPILWFGNWLVILLIALFGIRLWRKGNRIEGFATLVGFGFILASLGINKVNDDVGSIYLSSVRMFLVVPFLFSIILFWLWKDIKFTHNFHRLILQLAIFLVVVKLINLDGFIGTITQKKSQPPIEIKEYGKLSEQCKEIDRVAYENKVDAILVVPTWERQYAYFEYFSNGCECLEMNLPPTLIAFGERRAWHFDHLNAMRPKTILFYFDFKNAIVRPELKSRLIRVSANMPLYLLKDNNETFETLSQLYGFTYRRSFY